MMFDAFYFFSFVTPAEALCALRHSGTNESSHSQKHWAWQSSVALKEFFLDFLMIAK